MAPFCNLFIERPSYVVISNPDRIEGKYQGIRCQTFQHWLQTLCLVWFIVCMIKHIILCVLLKALGDAADFKTDKTLERLENFLKLCNNQAKEKFFGYFSTQYCLCYYQLSSFECTVILTRMLLCLSAWMFLLSLLINLCTNIFMCFAN